MSGSSPQSPENVHLSGSFAGSFTTATHQIDVAMPLEAEIPAIQAAEALRALPGEGAHSPQWKALANLVEGSSSMGQNSPTHVKNVNAHLPPQVVKLCEALSERNADLSAVQEELATARQEVLTARCTDLSEAEEALAAARKEAQKWQAVAVTAEQRVSQIAERGEVGCLPAGSDYAIQLRLAESIQMLKKEVEEERQALGVHVVEGSVWRSQAAESEARLRSALEEEESQCSRSRDALQQANSSLEEMLQLVAKQESEVQVTEQEFQVQEVSNQEPVIERPTSDSIASGGTAADVLLRVVEALEKGVKVSQLWNWDKESSCWPHSNRAVPARVSKLRQEAAEQKEVALNALEEASLCSEVSLSALQTEAELHREAAMDSSSSIARSESAQEGKVHTDLFLAGSAEDLHSADSAAGVAPSSRPRSTSPVDGVSRRLEVIGSAVNSGTLSQMVTLHNGQHSKGFTSRVEVASEVPSKVSRSCDVTWPSGLLAHQQHKEGSAKDIVANWGKTLQQESERLQGRSPRIVNSLQIVVGSSNRGNSTPSQRVIQSSTRVTTPVRIRNPKQLLSQPARMTQGLQKPIAGYPLTMAMPQVQLSRNISQASFQFEDANGKYGRSLLRQGPLSSSMPCFESALRPRSATPGAIPSSNRVACSVVIRRTVSPAGSRPALHTHTKSQQKLQNQSEYGGTHSLTKSTKGMTSSHSTDVGVEQLTRSTSGFSLQKQSARSTGRSSTDMQP